MTGLMKEYPQYLGIGIDEATAIVVQGQTLEVVGKSKVAIYGRSTPASGDLIIALTPGGRFDLVLRREVK